MPTLGLAAKDAPKDLWAPDLSFSHGEWRLYYAVSTFGTNQSVIGLATTRTLDPSSPRYGWHDRGLVLKSTDYRKPGGDAFNALDPNIVVDRSGATWLSTGSFFSGISVHRIDATTGKIRPGDVAVPIAERAAPDAEENSSIAYHAGYYYLFLSFDNCCRSVDSDYRTVVGRSRSVTGPYVDATGAAMLNGKGGTEVMRGYDEFVGAGGADVLLDTGGRDWIVNHYYDATDDGAPKLNVRHLTWARSGWPRASAPINGSRTIGHGDAYVAIEPAGQRTAVADSGCGYESAPLALAAPTGDLCQRWQVSDRGAGSRITNRFSNDVAEDAACKNVDGAAVAQWPWLGYQGSNPCQRWTFTTAADGTTSVASVQAGARTWTATGDPAAAGTPITIGAPTGAADQRFRFQPLGAVLLGSPTDGTRTLGEAGSHAAFQRRSAHAAQEWRAVRIGSSARYRLVSTTDGRVLTATSGGLRVESPRRAGAAAAWTIAPANDGTWTLRAGSHRQSVRLLLP